MDDRDLPGYDEWINNYTEQDEDEECLTREEWDLQFQEFG